MVWNVYSRPPSQYYPSCHLPPFTFNLSQALVVPIIEFLASPGDCTGRAPRVTDTTALSPASSGAARGSGGGRSAGAGRDLAGRARDSSAGGSRGTSTRAGDAEPRHIVGPVDADVVGDAGAVDAHQVAAVDVLGVLG